MTQRGIHTATPNKRPHPGGDSGAVGENRAGDADGRAGPHDHHDRRRRPRRLLRAVQGRLDPRGPAVPVITGTNRRTVPPGRARRR